MYHKNIDIDGKTAEGYVIPLGKVNLVFAIVPEGMLGCDAFDVAVLDKFDYPAAKIGSTDGSPVTTLDNLFDGIVEEVNEAASKKGIKKGISGREALKLF